MVAMNLLNWWTSVIVGVAIIEYFAGLILKRNWIILIYTVLNMTKEALCKSAFFTKFPSFPYMTHVT